MFNLCVCVCVSPFIFVNLFRFLGNARVCLFFFNTEVLIPVYMSYLNYSTHCILWIISSQVSEFKKSNQINQVMSTVLGTGKSMNIIGKTENKIGEHSVERCTGWRKISMSWSNFADSQVSKGKHQMNSTWLAVDCLAKLFVWRSPVLNPDICISSLKRFSSTISF